MRTCFGREVPVNPPSVFPHCESSFQRQTVKSKPRLIDDRKVSSTSRSEIFDDELKDFNNQDMIQGDFDAFYEKLTRSSVVDFQRHRGCVMRDRDKIVILSFSEPFRDIDYSLSINSDFHITAFRSNTKLSLAKFRDILGFQYRLTRWLQVDAILTRLKVADLDEEKEVNGAVEKLKETLRYMNKLSSKYEFLFDQLLLRVVPSEARRYSTFMIMKALNMFMVSRVSYRNLRTFLALPHPDTLMKGIGSAADVGSLSDAERISKIVFDAVSDIEKYCLIIFDEIYVKPSVRYRSGHVFGYATDDSSKLARTVLAFMIKPIFGTRSYVIRLLPVFKLTAEFIELNLLELIRIVESSGAITVGIMSDNLSTNRKLHHNLKQKFSGAEQFKIQHPLDSERSLYLLFDPVHLYKSIRNNWETEKTQTLKFTPPGHEEPFFAKWSDLLEISLITSPIPWRYCPPSM
jgi:hypothetical protein